MSVRRTCHEIGQQGLQVSFRLCCLKSLASLSSLGRVKPSNPACCSQFHSSYPSSQSLRNQSCTYRLRLAVAHKFESPVAKYGLSAIKVSTTSLVEVVLWSPVNSLCSNSSPVKSLASSGPSGTHQKGNHASKLVLLLRRSQVTAKSSCRNRRGSSTSSATYARDSRPATMKSHSEANAINKL